MERDDPVPNHKHTLCLSVIILLSKDIFARDRCCAKMHNCSFYLHVQLLMPLVPGLNVQMQNSEVLIMSPCLKSRFFIRSHIPEMYHGLVPEAETGKEDIFLWKESLEIRKTVCIQWRDVLESCFSILLRTGTDQLKMSTPALFNMHSFGK